MTNKKYLVRITHIVGDRYKGPGAECTLRKIGDDGKSEVIRDYWSYKGFLIPSDILYDLARSIVREHKFEEGDEIKTLQEWVDYPWEGYQARPLDPHELETFQKYLKIYS